FLILRRFPACRRASSNVSSVLYRSRAAFRTPPRMRFSDRDQFMLKACTWVGEVRFPVQGFDALTPDGRVIRPNKDRLGKLADRSAAADFARDPAAFLAR